MPAYVIVDVNVRDLYPVEPLHASDLPPSLPPTLEILVAEQHPLGRATRS